MNKYERGRYMKTIPMAVLFSFAVVLAIVLAVPSAHAQAPEENVFEVSPGSFTVRDAPPLGATYLIEQQLGIRNRVNEMRIFTLSVRTPLENELTEGYDAIPNENWIILMPMYMEIGENSIDNVQIMFDIPRWENLTSQQWEAWIAVKRMAEPGEVLEIEYIVRMKIITTAELPPLPSGISSSTIIIIAVVVVAAAVIIGIWVWSKRKAGRAEGRVFS